MIPSLALRLLDALAAVVPARWLYSVARWVGTLALPVFERKRIAVRANVQRLRPAMEPRDLDRATRGVFQENACYYVDAALLARITPPDVLRKHLSVEGLDLLQDAVAEGNGVVLAGAHLSNSEVPFQALAALGIDALALVEPLQDRRRMDAMQRRRQASGLRFVPATMDGVRQAIEMLRSGGVVAILTDRDIQGKGTCIPFAKRLAKFPTGAVDLAMRTDAKLLIGLAIRERNDHFRVLFLPTDELLRSDNRALDLRANLASLIRRMEPIIAANVDQWRVFESPWKPCHDTPYVDPREPRVNPRKPSVNPRKEAAATESPASPESAGDA